MPTDTLNLENLYQTYKNQIYTLCIKLTRSQMHADDLFGTTWVKVAEKFANIQKEKNPRNWIYTICLNLYRKSAPKWQEIAISDEDVASEIIAKAQDANVEDSMVEQETIQQLQKAVSLLNDKYRIPIILFYFRELSYNEISQIMKLPMSTVKFRLSYAKELLKKEMEVLL
ncbi:MAG: sigma-70 family RNA polymerase sigma factor [Lentimicrobiaceae bacterium]|nr:sigma-70 family RNA polymerase sigma factor [Lentimicrobiaceae bacterium]